MPDVVPLRRYDARTMTDATFNLTCDDCHRVAPPRPYSPRCPHCDGALAITYRDTTTDRYRHAPRSMWGYGDVQIGRAHV